MSQTEILALPSEEIVKAYKAGESLSSLARHYSVNILTIKNRIKKAGVEIDSSRRREQHGEKNASWKGGKRAYTTRTTREILLVAGVDLRLCMNCGFRSEDKELDRHHIDGDKENNVLENLEVLCVTCHNSGWSGARHVRLRNERGVFI